MLLIQYSYKLLLEGNVTKKDLKNEEIRYNLFKIYFEENKFNNEKQCIEFFKNKYLDKFNITEDIYNEIKNAKRNVNYKNNSILNIINLIENLEDKNHFFILLFNIKMLYFLIFK